MRRRASVWLAVLAAMAMAMATPAEAAGEPLGRLFLTPEQRAALERQRRTEADASAALQGETLRLDGIVRRSSGHRTVWLNGHATDDNGTAARRVGPRHDDPAAAVIAGDGAAPLSLRVGETVNRATRERTDGLAGGRLSIRQAPGGR
jgi:hypothetical protein